MQRLASDLMPTLFNIWVTRFSFWQKLEICCYYLLLKLLLCLNCYNHNLLFENIDIQVWFRVMSQLLKSCLLHLSQTISLGNTSHRTFQRSPILVGITLPTLPPDLKSWWKKLPHSPTSMAMEATSTQLGHPLPFSTVHRLQHLAGTTSRRTAHEDVRRIN
jgi:hypothetical protein